MVSDEPWKMTIVVHSKVCILKSYHLYDTHNLSQQNTTKGYIRNISEIERRRASTLKELLLPTHDLRILGSSAGESRSDRLLL